MQPLLVTHPTSSGRGSDHYWFAHRPLLVQRRTSSGSPVTLYRLLFRPHIYLCYTLRRSPFEEVENYLAGGINTVWNVGEATLFFTSEQEFWVGACIIE